MLPILHLFLKKAPFIRLVLPLILGIYCSNKYLAFSYRYIYISLFVLAIFATLIYWQQAKAKYKYRYLSGISSFVLFVSLAVVYGQLRKPMVISSADSATIRVELIEPIGVTDKNIKYEAYLLGSEADSLNCFWGGRGIVYLPKSMAKESWSTADQFCLSGRFIPFAEPDSRFDFDYSGYLRNQRIAFRFFIKDYKHMISEKQTYHPVIWSAKLKNYLRNKYQETGLNESQLAILNALFLGDKSLLTYEQKRAFSDAGAMHLLAVSGLHVGIIYMLLIGISSLFRVKRQTWWIATLIILCLWFYAAVTGFSPSVLRASLMFTILEIGRMSNRQTGIFNLLGASMFIIILIEPLSVFNIGFWLSHAAVASIVSFYPKINGWLHFRFPPFRWGWSIIAVSLAAQLGTLPIGIFAFHAFPLYFIITNVLLIPIVTPILILAVVAALSSFSVFCLKLIVPAMGTLLSFMDETAHWIERLPYSSVEHLYVEWWQLPILYACLIFLLVYVDYRFTNYLKYLMISIIVALTSFHYRLYHLPDEVLYVAKINGKSVVNYITQEHNVIYTTAALQVKEIEFAFAGLWAYCHAPPAYRIMDISNKQNGLPVVNLQGDKRLVILPERARCTQELEGGKVDYLVLMGQPAITLEELRNLIRVRQLIIPNGWKQYQRNWFSDYGKWVENLHDVSRDGVFFVAYNHD